MRNLRVSTGASFYDAPSGQEFSWPSLVHLLSTYDTGTHTLEQYLALSKPEQLKAKDVGWYNGNTYSRPERLAQYVVSIDLLTLDIDNGDAGIDAAIAELFDPVFGDIPCAYFLGSTRKHTPAAPRLRLVVPLARPCTVDEADALRRMLAFRIGMPTVDTVSFRANQVMFWPSRCADGEILTRVEADAPALDPDRYLAKWYPLGWERRESWPLHPAEEPTALTHGQKRAGDPHEKPGMVGQWCRAFTITDVLEQFLADEYTPGSKEDRWTHVGGTAGDGAIVYEDKWLYSHHQTDPGTGQLLNAWDLVRVHKFGALDAGTPDSTPIARRKSTRAMEEWVRKQPEFIRVLAADAASEFSPITDDADAPAREEVVELAERFQFGKGGRVAATRPNLDLILSEHPTFKGALAFNVNAGMQVWRRFMPWHDETRKLTRLDVSEGLQVSDIDATRVREWIERSFNIEPIGLAVLQEVLDLVADRNRFHPIRDYLRALPVWDGTPRLSTLFSRYLGTPDDEYHRAAARMLMIGAVKRMMEPGCKFDSVVLIIGPQRIRKSWFIAALAGEPNYFTDDLKTFDRDGVASIRSVWFVELAELAQFARNEQEIIKAFISRRVDRVRLAFERHVQNFPRQCVFVGTANGSAPLKDTTGNGRYLPVWTQGYHELERKIDVESLVAEVPQLHAEAFAAWAAGEAVHMTDAKAAEQAAEAQEAARPDDPIANQIDAWLDGEVPSVRCPPNVGDFQNQKPEVRFQTCVKQIACEALGYDPYGKDWPTWLSSRIADHMGMRWGRTDGRESFKGYGRERAYHRGGAKSPKPAPTKPFVTMDDL